MHVETTLVYLILIVAAAKIAGEVAEYFHQPAVVGELLAGVLLGLTGLRAAVDNPAIVFIATIGITLLLFEVGIESEITDFLRAGRSAVLVAVIGVVVPMAAGFGARYAFGGNFNDALFLGATLTATSIGITTRVLSDLGKLGSKEANIIIGAAVIDDILGLLILSIVLQVISTARLDAGSVVIAVVAAVLFLVLSILVGTALAPGVVRFINKLKTRGVLVSSAFIFCLVLALAAEKIGLAEIIGAFAAGLVLAATDARTKIHEQIKPLTDIFVSVFFVLVGLQVDLRSLNPFDPSQRTIILMGLVFLVIAVVGKLLAGLGVTQRGISKLAVGVGMVPRGEVGLIFASVGLKNGIIGPGLYTELILVVFLSTIITPPWLKRVLRRSRTNPPKSEDTAQETG